MREVPTMFTVGDSLTDTAIDLLAAARGKCFGEIRANPPRQFQDGTGANYEGRER